METTWKQCLPLPRGSARSEWTVQIAVLIFYILSEGINGHFEEQPNRTLGASLHRKFGPKATDPRPASRPMLLEHFRAAQSLLKKAVELSQEASQARDLTKATRARSALCYILNFKLTHVAPRLTWSEQEMRWITGWQLQSLESALYLMLLFDLQSVGSIRTCPWCHSAFLADNPRAIFCQSSCQNANKVKAFRERAKQPKHRSRKSKMSRLKTIKGVQ